MTAFGISPLGEGLGPFGGPGLITVLGALPVSNNSFVVVFDREPRRLDTQSPFSGVNPENYTLVALDPTQTASNGDTFIPMGKVVPTVQPNSVGAVADTEDPKQIIVSTDADMEPGVDYEVTISPAIKSVDADVFAGTSTFGFLGRSPSRVIKPIEVFEEQLRDFDYQLVPRPNQPNAPTQVYNFDDNGDIALQGNDASLKKRIFRRILTKKGDFAFLPRYGAGLQIKTLIRPSKLQEIANEVAAQAKLEPDVVNAGASAEIRRSETGSFVIIQVFVQSRDLRERVFLYEFPNADANNST